MRFSRFINAVRARKGLVVQPRMGFSTIDEMRRGLRYVRDAACDSVGTITLDSYTRVGDHQSARQALERGLSLNGFPIVVHGAAATREMLNGIQDDGFPVQVRHGCATPETIFETLVAAGIDATEGGPVSYCLPYSRTPLQVAIDAWARSCELLAGAGRSGEQVHLESFGGCMLGQLCPPSLLVALSVLEGLFFVDHGLRSISLSYAQQTSFDQDRAALAVLRRLAEEFLADVDWHVVLYTYMGVFPRTHGGARNLLAESVRLAKAARVERLIVKTPAEAMRIPSIMDNVESLEYAATLMRQAQHREDVDAELFAEIYGEARSLIGNVLDLDGDPGDALRAAFQKGILDVPYCLHGDNANRARSYIDSLGMLRWESVGHMPILSRRPGSAQAKSLDAFEFLGMLRSVERRFDAPYLPQSAGSVPLEPRR